MQESLAYADSNPDEVRRIILTYTQVPEAAAAEIMLPSYPEEINWDSVKTVAELMQKYGITEEQADVDSLNATD
jgi:NitT/TauT family transport system substrate-binding protein